MPKLREDQAAVHVGITDPVSGAHLLDTLVWASVEGGDIEAKGVKTRPGGMGDEETLGAPKSRTDCTVTRQYTNDVLHPLVPQLERVAGNAPMSVSWTPLDGDGNPNGQTHTITGKLDSVMRPKRDANNTAASFLTLVMSCNVPMVVS